MASTFNLLTAGGARFDKSRFKRDFELFNPASSSKSGKKSRKGKEKEVPGGASGVLPANLDFFGDHSHATKAKPATEEDEDEDTVGEEDDELEENEERVEPPKQKITLSGVEPLPSSLHPNLPSLTTHENTALSSSAGKPLLKALSGANIHSLWGVQCAVGGSVLSGRDTMCIAPTGSGKTLSYLLPTIVRLQDPSKVIRRRATGADDSDEEAEEKDVDGEKDDGRGIRSIVLVPTYDLAIQIRAVLKAVTRGRAWRAMVLTKATERAICASAPGSKYNSWASTSEGAAGGDSEEDEEDEDESGDEDASDAESTGSVNEFAQDSAQAEGDTESEADDDVEDSAALGLDFLIATPERLHHLLERKLVSLSR
jgi:ATP-dependent RNA helicase DDX52/ROK1